MSEKTTKKGIKKHLNIKNIDESFDNIQVSKDEDINDFFDTWKKFKTRPSKITLFSQFNSDAIWNILLEKFNIKDSDINKLSEIFTGPSGILYNTKYYISVSDDIAISFYEFDKDDGIDEYQEIYSSNLTIFYNYKKVSPTTITSMSELFQTSMIDFDTDETTYKTTNSLYLDINNNFELKPIEFNSPILKKELKYLYNKEILDKIDGVIQEIYTNDKGLTIFNGMRGTGKTAMLNYVINSLDKKIIYIPAILIEHTFTNIDFMDFLKLNPKSVIVIDDCESFFAKGRYKHNTHLINLLQILDGITSDKLNINFILSMNIDNNEIDPDLLESNSLISNITFDKLNKTTATKLSKKIGHDIKYISDVKLGNVFKGTKKLKDSKYY